MLYFDTVKQYVLDVQLSIVREDRANSLVVVVVEDEDRGVKNLVVDCVESLLVVEQIIMPVPSNPGEMFRRLLQMNRCIVQGAFALDEEGTRVLYRHTLPLAHLHPNEVEGTIEALRLALAEFASELIGFNKQYRLQAGGGFRMSIFQRLFKMGQAEGHNVINTLEDPIRMTEQGIRDLKSDLQGAMIGLAEVKGVAIRLTKEAEEAKRQASEYERKAMVMLQRAQAGHMDMPQAERLATEALTMKDSASERAMRLFKDAEQQQRLASQLQEKIAQFKSTISTHENELFTLRGRAKTAAATKKINQQLSQIDSSSTIALLERMKKRVEEDEALAQAYGEVANVGASVDAEIDRALADSQTTSPQDRLAELKTKMGLNA